MRLVLDIYFWDISVIYYNFHLQSFCACAEHFLYSLEGYFLNMFQKSCQQMCVCVCVCVCVCGVVQ